MSREDLRKAVREARKRFKDYTSFENLLFICELLDLESDKFKEDKQDGIALELSKIGLKLSKLLGEV